LDDQVARFAREGRPELSRLRTELTGVDPDIAYSIVPYEKGALFLWTLELAVGRSAFDAFVRRYIERFRFQAVTTEEFVALADDLLPGAMGRIDAQQWLFEPGIPANAPVAQSSRLEAIEQLRGAPPSDELARTWRPTEWQLYLESLPSSVTADDLAGLDARFHLTQSRNYDVLEKWLTRAIAAGYQPGLVRAEDVLGIVGRMKYLRPLYRALAERPESRELAHAWFARFESRYHPIARDVVRHVLAMADA
jgi:aminopeptidase N